jgi:phage FluMu protein Com
MLQSTFPDIFNHKQNKSMLATNVILYVGYICMKCPSCKECYLAKQKQTESKLRGLGPQANYTGRATAACRRS